jgi:hypothetical protein
MIVILQDFTKFIAETLNAFFSKLVNNEIRLYRTQPTIYPIPGHSYLDCDRDFGLIEKKLHKTKCAFHQNMLNWLKAITIKYNLSHVILEVFRISVLRVKG